MLWGLYHGVPELRGPEEGDPHVEGILRGRQHMGKGAQRLGKFQGRFQPQA